MMNPKDMFHFEEDALNAYYREHEFNRTDDRWNECTEKYACDRRKKGFRVFQNVYQGSLVHIFPSYQYQDVMYYHVVNEHIGGSFPYKSDYELMIAKDIEKRFGLKKEAFEIPIYVPEEGD